MQNRISIVPLLAELILLAGCGHYANVAGNSMPTPVTTPTPATTIPGYWQLQTRDSNTGIAGAAGAPAPASFGASPVPEQTATTSGHPMFEPDLSVGAFPLLASSLQASGSGLSAVASSQSATATLTGVIDPRWPGLPMLAIQLSVPSVGVNARWEVNDILSVADDFGTYGLSYAVMGSWETRAAPASATGNLGPLQNVTWFTFGYETPASAMPTSGQASFTGFLEGDVFTPSAGGPIMEEQLSGKAGFSVDFSFGHITGALTQSLANGLPWNDVSVSASIAAGTNKFSGVTGVTSAPAGQFSLGASASGSINGGFYGPTAENLGAIWTLSDGTTSAIGGVAARQ